MGRAEGGGKRRSLRFAKNRFWRCGLFLVLPGIFPRNIPRVNREWAPLRKEGLSGRLAIPPHASLPIGGSWLLLPIVLVRHKDLASLRPARKVHCRRIPSWQPGRRNIGWDSGIYPNGLTMDGLLVAALCFGVDGTR
jgi:hypothetical protein